MEKESSKSEEKIKLNKNNFIGAILILIVVIGIAWQFNGNNIEEQTSSAMDNIYQKVADDAVAQYYIANRQGDKMQICVQAMQVSAAYLQAQDESNYQKWKDIEKIDCTIAGLPQ